MHVPAEGGLGVFTLLKCLDNDREVDENEKTTSSLSYLVKLSYPLVFVSR